MFPVRYELIFYILYKRNSVFKELNEFRKPSRKQRKNVCDYVYVE
jgi:hypothetical protein